MTHRWFAIVGSVLPTLLAAQDAQTLRGPYARIAIIRPHDGHTVDFESGYIRHLEWHRQNRDTWVWYGWTVTFGERQRWFVYASFGHSAASLDNVVSPAEDERDNVQNVAPYVEYAGNGIYEYLPGLSRGTGEPQPSARMELTTVDLVPQGGKCFRIGPPRGPIGIAGRDAVVSDGGGWSDSALCPAATAAEPVGASRR